MSIPVICGPWFWEVAEKIVTVLLFLPDEFMQLTICFLFLRYHGGVTNRERDCEQTCFPGKLHKACVCFSVKLRSRLLIFLLCGICMLPLEETDILLYLCLLHQWEINPSNGNILFTARRRNSWFIKMFFLNVKNKSFQFWLYVFTWSPGSGVKSSNITLSSPFYSPNALSRTEQYPFSFYMPCSSSIPSLIYDGR